MHAMRARLRAVRENFWFGPSVGIALAAIAGIVLPLLDRYVTVPDALTISGGADTARAVLSAIVALGVSVAGVSFSVIVVALVLASQQLSPRVLRSFQRESLNQVVLAFLLGTATFAAFVLAAVGKSGAQPVPEASATIAMILAAVSLALFAAFLHHVVRTLNASSVIRRIAAQGHESVDRPFPDGVGREPEDGAGAQRRVEGWRGLPCRIEVRAPRAGYVASVDGRRIIAWARSADAFVEQTRAVGSFALANSTLALIWCEDDRDVDPGAVGRAFKLAEERVVDGDIGFPVRQLADVALKGLSPGINDPTTAENAMDSLTDTLARFARRHQPSPIRCDEDGVPRLRAIAPTLDGLVLLGFDEVRRDGAGRPSFCVRLLELLAELRDAAAEAGDCHEIDRQARLVAEHAARLAEVEADRELVLGAYERLHGGDRPGAGGAGAPVTDGAGRSDRPPTTARR